MITLVSITPTTVAERHREAYVGSRHYLVDGRLNDGRTPEEVEAQLRALPATASKDDINAVIGNHSWTMLRCTQCGEDVSTVAHLEEPHEQHWFRWAQFHLCLPCAKRVVAMLEGTS